MKNYNISDGMKRDVKNKDIIAIRSRFFTLLASCPCGDKIKAYIDYCLKNGIEKDVLFIKNKGQVFNENKEEWNYHYWDNVGYSVEKNFSEEYLNHIIAVANYLYKEDEAKCEAKSKESNSSNNSKKIIIAASAIAIITLTVILSIKCS